MHCVSIFSFPMSEAIEDPMCYPGETALGCRTCGMSATVSFWISEDMKTWKLRCNVCREVKLEKGSDQELPEIVVAVQVIQQAAGQLDAADEKREQGARGQAT